MKLSKKIQFAFLFALLAWLLPACRGGYSFTGASLSPEIKTVSIEYFQNMAPIVVPTLSNTLTEALITKFRRQTNLRFVDFGGDLAFEGEITGYNVVSIDVQANEVASKNRLTITVKIRCVNAKDEKLSFDKSFESYADFTSTQSLESVQNALIDQIVTTLVENIFNQAVANW